MCSLASAFHAFSYLLMSLGRSSGVFWRPFGVSVVSLACWCYPFGCLWLAWAVCGLSLLLFVVPLARLGCLWARGPLRGCFLVHFRDLFHVFSIVFSFASVVEAAPQARPKTTAVANTALRPSPCSPPSFNALPVPLLRQVTHDPSQPGGPHKEGRRIYHLLLIEPLMHYLNKRLSIVQYPINDFERPASAEHT